MKTTADYLDALRAKWGLPSDYALQERTGWSRSHLSQYRTLKNAFNDETALKVAAWLDVPPQEVIIDMHAQRAREHVALRAVWELIGKKVAGVAAAALLVYVTTPNDSSIALMQTALASAGSAQSLCIM